MHYATATAPRRPRPGGAGPGARRRERVLGKGDVDDRDGDRLEQVDLPPRAFVVDGRLGAVLAYKEELVGQAVGPLLI